MCKIMDELIAESREESRIEGRIEMAISSVKSLMESLCKNTTEAMELLNIPEGLRPQIIASIEG